MAQLYMFNEQEERLAEQIRIDNIEQKERIAEQMRINNNEQKARIKQLIASMITANNQHQNQ